MGLTFNLIYKINRFFSPVSIVYKLWFYFKATMKINVTYANCSMANENERIERICSLFSLLENNKVFINPIK